VLLALTTTGKVTLLAVAGTFILFALVTAIVVPRRRPEFPGDRLGAYIAVVGLLFVAQMSAVVWVAETQEGEEHGAAETMPGETGGEETQPAETETGPGATETQPGETETQPGAAETEPAETETGETTTGETEGGAQGDAAAGRQVFESAGCASCHTLAAAGSTGTVGPNLDQAHPSFDKAVERVTNGKAPMPPFKGQLTEQQIRDVAAFVSESTRG
jgi:mono/diheme cytochrome c family protein